MAPILELNSDEQIVRRYLERAMDGSIASAVSLRLVQRFATETPELFCHAALTLLESDGDCPAHRFMIVRLLHQPRLLSMLSDPARLDRTMATQLFRLLMPHDPVLDVRLAHCLPDRRGISETHLDQASCGRALDVLDEISAGRRIVPIIGHLVDHPVPRLASKAALVVGRRVRSVDWTKRLLYGDRNHRDRANAVQALWGLNTYEARSLFWEHTADRNNRVAGNAVAGLLVIGEERIASTVQRMAHRPEPEFRWTSAWLMARIGHPESLDLLKQMMKDRNPGVRRAVLRALVGIRQEQIRKATDEERRRVEHKETEPAPVEAPAPLQSWPELKADPEFNLRLDGRSFSFRRA